jgi:hypothetical protein
MKLNARRRNLFLGHLKAVVVAPELFQAQDTMEDNHSLLMRAPTSCARVTKLLRTAMLGAQSLKKHAAVFQKGVQCV